MEPRPRPGAPVPLIPLSGGHPLPGDAPAGRREHSAHRAGTVAVETSASWMHGVTRAIVPAHPSAPGSRPDRTLPPRVQRCSYLRGSMELWRAPSVGHDQPRHRGRHSLPDAAASELSEWGGSFAAIAAADHQRSYSR